MATATAKKPKKKASTKKPARTTKTKTVKAKAPVIETVLEAKRGPGRPKGTTQFKTDWIAVRKEFPYSHKDAKVVVPGTRRIVIECSEPEPALQLHRLALAIKEKNPALLKLLKPAKPKK